MRVDWVRPRVRGVEWLGAPPPVIELYQPTKTLEDIVPEQRPKFVALMEHAKTLGMMIKIRSAGRTCATQQEYYDLGEKVTQANLCRSMHVFGHAVDFDVVPNKCASYTQLGEWWEKQGGVWGGRWKQFGACGDQGHFHIGMNGAQAVPTSLCPTPVSASECRAIREDYLNKAFSQSTSAGGSRMGLLSGLLIVGAAAALLYATVNVRAPARVRENPEIWYVHVVRDGDEYVAYDYDSGEELDFRASSRAALEREVREYFPRATIRFVGAR